MGCGCVQITGRQGEITEPQMGKKLLDWPCSPRNPVECSGGQDQCRPLFPLLGEQGRLLQPHTGQQRLILHPGKERCGFGQRGTGGVDLSLACQRNPGAPECPRSLMCHAGLVKVVNDLAIDAQRLVKEIEREISVGHLAAIDLCIGQRGLVGKQITGLVIGGERGLIITEQQVGFTQVTLGMRLQ